MIFISLFILYLCDQILHFCVNCKLHLFSPVAHACVFPAFMRFDNGQSWMSSWQMDMGKLNIDILRGAGNSMNISRRTYFCSDATCVQYGIDNVEATFACVRRVGRHKHRFIVRSTLFGWVMSNSNLIRYENFLARVHCYFGRSQSFFWWSSFELIEAEASRLASFNHVHSRKASVPINKGRKSSKIIGFFQVY